MLSAFQIALKIQEKKELEIVIQFKKIPDEKIIKEVYNNLNDHFLEGNYNFRVMKDDFLIRVDEGESLKILLPRAIYENKLKDKLEEESKQFDEGELNIVVIDITPMIGDICDFVNCIRDYFEYTENKLLSGVILLTENYLIENLELIFRKGVFCIMNPNLANNKFIESIIRKLCEN